MIAADSSNIVLTGLPRSGSTLTCHLMNRCADTVALHEPIPIGQLVHDHGAGALPEHIERFFAKTRHSLLTERRAPSKMAKGQVPDNNCAPDRPGFGDLRPTVVALGEVTFEGKDLSPDFVLAVKHNTGFAALLDRLVERYRCFGIVRNPLAVLGSWNSVDMPVQQGFIPVGELIDGKLGVALRRIEDRTERQFYILEWFFERFQRSLPTGAILRYEEMIASGGRSLAVITPGAEALCEPLASRNENPVYSAARMIELGEKLMGRDGAFWDFYSKESVEEMLIPLRSGSRT